MIDIHSHILPGVDDGAKDIEMTLEMLRAAEKSGTKSIIATPHYCLEFAETPYLEIKDIILKLKKLTKSEGINIDIYSGQEVYFFEEIVNTFKEGIIGTLNDSRYMLIELPMREYEKSFLDVIYELQVLGIVPILAHPERYNYIIENPSLVNKLIDENILFQMNAGSISGKYGKSVKRTSEILLENNIYNFIGSDAHNVTNRNISMAESINLIRELGEGNLNRFTDNGMKIIKNEIIDFEGEKIKSKKSIFSFLK
jgi:protein-tyrosine phosphatase